MNSSNYFTWELDPVIFTIPEFNLPFPLSIWGLILGFVLIYFGFQQIKPKSEKQEPESWKIWGVILGALVIAQIPFLLIDSPSLTSIGPIQPRWYGLMWVCAFAFGYMIGLKMFKDAGRSVEELDRLLMYVLVATVIGARLGHVFFYEADFYLRNVHLIPQVWTGGLASHGAAIGIIIAMYLFARKTHGVTFFWVADRVVPGVAIGGMFIRIGNFFNSALISFSGKPLQAASLIGLGGIVISFLMILFIFFIKVYGITPPGRAAIMTAIMFLGSIQLLALGILGLYVHSIFIMAKQRPNFIIESVYGFSEEELDLLQNTYRNNLQIF